MSGGIYVIKSISSSNQTFLCHLSPGSEGAQQVNFNENNASRCPPVHFQTLHCLKIATLDSCDRNKSISLLLLFQKTKSLKMHQSLGSFFVMFICFCKWHVPDYILRSCTRCNSKYNLSCLFTS